MKLSPNAPALENQQGAELITQIDLSNDTEGRQKYRLRFFVGYTQYGDEFLTDSFEEAKMEQHKLWRELLSNIDLFQQNW